MLQDLRYVLRSLGHRPLYATMTILVFALAIGANATVFGVYHGFFLRPLPYPAEDRLVMIDSSMPKIGVEFAGTSIPEYLERREAPSLEALALLRPQQRTLGGAGSAEQLTVVRVSPSLFDVLGAAPLLGRGFTEDEAIPGQDRVVVLADSLWRTRFGARADLVGQDVRLDGEAFRVVGVMPPGFAFPDRNVDLWEPFSFTAAQSAEDQRGYTNALSVGRLRPGATIADLEADLRVILERTLARLPEIAARVENLGYMARVRPWRETVVGTFRPVVTLLQGLVAIVLLIASANVANLQLARMLARRKELTVRAALGASRWRLARLVFLESLLLAAVGGALGLAGARVGFEIVRALGLDGADLGFEFALDPAVFAFTLVAVLGAAIVAGLLPLIAEWRVDAGTVARSAAPRGGGSVVSRRLGSALVVFQVATGVALLVAAGLLVKSFEALQRDGPGFEAEGVWTAAIGLPGSRYATDDARTAFYEQALADLGALPGVTAVSLTTALPFRGDDISGTIIVEGYEPPAGAPPTAELRAVSERYFETLGVPVIEGRTFAPNESERVAIVTDTMGRTFWPGRSPLGQRVRNTPEDAWATVVGVVPSVKHSSLRDDSGRHTIYWPYRQRTGVSAAVFAVRSAVPSAELGGAARDVISRLDADLALYDVQPLATRVARSLGPQRTPMALTLAFAGLALALAGVGIYGVLAFAVSQRVGEIGVRLALGARAADILRLVMGQGVRLLAAGVVLGVGAAVALGRVLSAQLYAVSPLDPLVFVVAIVTLSAAALLASWLPARRAASTDPMRALRAE